jgi:catechol 2,3-dioxygenase-like lactoylglutathione lyase family enzyme
MSGDAPVKFHLSLGVSHLARSVAFYRVLLDIAPAKHRNDYAKFEIDSPPLVLSLIPSHPARGGALNHAGLRLSHGEALVAMQARLEAAGLETTREADVACCHSMQTKFWVADPDGVMWEIYVLLEDEKDHDPDHPLTSSDQLDAVDDESLPLVWQHCLGEPPPLAIPHPDGVLDEVRWEGTLNQPLDSAQLAAICGEALRALKPGGRVTFHGLVGDKPLARAPALPGPAAAVSFVPLETQSLQTLESHGFVGGHVVRLGPAVHFVVDGVSLRETYVSAYKPAPPPAENVQVIYRGPLARVMDDRGNIFPRGKRVTIDPAAWQRLRHGPGADHFQAQTCGDNPTECC